MNNKCKCNWKDGKFEGCDKFDGQFIYDITIYDTEGVDVKSAKCLHCKTDIRKPEEKPLIVKSGGTLVAHFEGVNYLCIDPNNTTGTIEAFKNQLKLSNIWKPFSEIILTDEIAKLRPMIKDRMQVRVLLAIWDGIVKTDGYSFDLKNKIPNLATPHELQEIPNA